MQWVSSASQRGTGFWRLNFFFFFLAATEESKGLRKRPGNWHSWGPLVANKGPAQEGGLGSCRVSPAEESWAENFVFLISELDFTLQRGVLRV